MVNRTIKIRGVLTYCVPMNMVVSKNQLDPCKSLLTEFAELAKILYNKAGLKHTVQNQTVAIKPTTNAS